MNDKEIDIEKWYADEMYKIKHNQHVMDAKLWSSVASPSSRAPRPKVEPCVKFDKDIYSLKMGEDARLIKYDGSGDEEDETIITRVPGGWIWGGIFVAMNDEFKSQFTADQYGV